MTHQSQSNQILMALLAGEEVSTGEIHIRFHCVDGRKRLSELRDQGYNIQFRWVEENGARFKKHFIPKDRIFSGTNIKEINMIKDCNLQAPVSP